MKLDLTTNRGKANVKWSYDEAHPYLAEGQIKSFLLAAFFARTLVNNPQNSMEFIRRIESSSKFLMVGGNFIFDEWWHIISGERFLIFPWEIVSNEQNLRGKVYKIEYYKKENPDKISYDLKMQAGLEKVLAISAPLIAYQCITSQMSDMERIYLGYLTRSISLWYLKQGNFPLGSDSKALVDSITLVEEYMSELNK